VVVVVVGLEVHFGSQLAWLGWISDGTGRTQRGVCVFEAAGMLGFAVFGAEYARRDAQVRCCVVMLFVVNVRSSYV
jgi:hypothetical protein